MRPTIFLRLNDRLLAAGLAAADRLYGLHPHRSRCFMMTPLGFTVSPDGRLFNCSHCMQDGQCVGSVPRYDPTHPIRQAFLNAEPSAACTAYAAFQVCRGGCRIGELQLAPMPQRHPYKHVRKEIQDQNGR